MFPPIFYINHLFGHKLRLFFFSCFLLCLRHPRIQKRNQQITTVTTKPIFWLFSNTEFQIVFFCVILTTELRTHAVNNGCIHCPIWQCMSHPFWAPKKKHTPRADLPLSSAAASTWLCICKAFSAWVVLSGLCRLSRCSRMWSFLLCTCYLLELLVLLIQRFFLSGIKKIIFKKSLMLSK